MNEVLGSNEVIKEEINLCAKVEPSFIQEGHDGISTSDSLCYIHSRPEDYKLYNEILTLLKD